MVTDVAPGQIVILNGIPRSGKSSIAAAIQVTFGGLWMNLGVDTSIEMTPPLYRPGIGLRPGGERPDLEPMVARLFFALYESIGAHSGMGINVVADVGHHDSYSKPMGILPECARRVRGLPVLFVGVRCPISVVRERRLATGMDRADTLESDVLRRIELWDREVHTPGVYDLEVDTSTMSPSECVAAIRRRLDDGLAASAFERIAALTVGTID